MSLSTGRQVHRKQWTSMKVNQRVIDRVEALGVRDNQPLVGENFDFKTKAKRSTRMTFKKRGQGDTSPVYGKTQKEGTTRVHEQENNETRDDESWCEDPTPTVDVDLCDDAHPNEDETSNQSEVLS